MEQDERFKQITLIRLQQTVEYYIDEKFGTIIQHSKCKELSNLIINEIIHYENSDRDVLDYERVYKKPFVKSSGVNES